MLFDSESLPSFYGIQWKLEKDENSSEVSELSGITDE
jgi:hypothetical protein